MSAPSHGGSAHQAGFNTARFFVQHRQVAWVLLAVTLAWGWLGFHQMPRSKDPNVPVRVAVAVAAWPGVSATEVEQQLTRLLEERIAESSAVHPATADAYGIRSTSLPGLAVVYVQLAENIRDTVRSALAWEAIDDDKETTGRLDEAQKRTLAKQLGRAKSDIREALWRSYRNLYLLAADNKLRHVDLGQITSSMADSLPELILNQLTQTDEVVKSVGPSKLVRYWPGAIVEWSTKAARDAFYASPQLPRLLAADVIKLTIADGVSRGELGYATKNEIGRAHV